MKIIHDFHSFHNGSGNKFMRIWLSTFACLPKKYHWLGWETSFYADPWLKILKLGTFSYFRESSANAFECSGFKVQNWEPFPIHKCATLAKAKDESDWVRCRTKGQDINYQCRQTIAESGKHLQMLLSGAWKNVPGHIQNFSYFLAN